jgi:hypothetical protein
MKNWSELMASVEVLQTKSFLIEGYEKPGNLMFTLKRTTASVVFYPYKGKELNICTANYTTLQEATERVIENIFVDIKVGRLKFANEN